MKEIREEVWELVEEDDCRVIEGRLAGYMVRNEEDAWRLSLIKWAVVTKLEEEGRWFCAREIGKRWTTCGLCKYVISEEGFIRCERCLIGKKRGKDCFDEWVEWYFRGRPASEVLARIVEEYERWKDGKSEV